MDAKMCEVRVDVACCSKRQGVWRLEVPLSQMRQKFGFQCGMISIFDL